MGSQIVKIVTLFLILNSHYSFADTKLSDILFPSDNQIHISQLQKVTEAEIKEIIKNIEIPKESCLDQFKPENEEYMLDVWLHSLNKYDFSGDGINDLIFISKCGTTEIKNYFWTKKGKKYHYSGLMAGNLIKLFRKKEGQALSGVTFRGWCCVSVDGSISLYAPEFSHDIVKYRLHREIKVISGLKRPDKRALSKRFIIKKEKYRLRSSPRIIDEYSNDLAGEPVYGNIIAEFARGGRGEAIAESADETDEIWWFVIIDKDAKTTYNRLYSNENTSMVGWMSSRYLEVAK